MYSVIPFGFPIGRAPAVLDVPSETSESCSRLVKTYNVALSYTTREEYIAIIVIVKRNAVRPFAGRDLIKFNRVKNCSDSVQDALRLYFNITTRRRYHKYTFYNEIRTPTEKRFKSRSPRVLLKHNI